MQIDYGGFGRGMFLDRYDSRLSVLTLVQAIIRCVFFDARLNWLSRSKMTAPAMVDDGVMGVSTNSNDQDLDLYYKSVKLVDDEWRLVEDHYRLSNQK